MPYAQGKKIAFSNDFGDDHTGPNYIGLLSDYEKAMNAPVGEFNPVEDGYLSSILLEEVSVKWVVLCSPSPLTHPDCPRLGVVQ